MFPLLALPPCILRSAHPKLITKKSCTQVINIKNKSELKKYIKKNLFTDEVVICMGAGNISNWIREIGNELK